LKPSNLTLGITDLLKVVYRKWWKFPGDALRAV
jgi:hypothetical protein